jgi:hypothetical protein
MTEKNMETKAKGTAEIEFVLRDKDGKIKDREIVKVNLNGTPND